MIKKITIKYCEKNNSWIIEDSKNQFKENKYRTMEAAIFDAKCYSMETGEELDIVTKKYEVEIKRGYHQ